MNSENMFHLSLIVSWWPSCPIYKINFYSGNRYIVWTGLTLLNNLTTITTILKKPLSVVFKAFLQEQNIQVICILFVYNRVIERQIQSKPDNLPSLCRWTHLIDCLATFSLFFSVCLPPVMGLSTIPTESDTPIDMAQHWVSTFYHSRNVRHPLVGSDQQLLGERVVN